jgi:hypothetical protein
LAYLEVVSSTWQMSGVAVYREDVPGFGVVARAHPRENGSVLFCDRAELRVAVRPRSADAV